jgi:hypothetical protein
MRFDRLFQRRRERLVDLAAGHLKGHSSEPVARWRRQLAAGRSWSEVEVEVLIWSGARIDRLTRLLIEAETTTVPAWPPVPGPDAAHDPQPHSWPLSPVTVSSGT